MSPLSASRLHQVSSTAGSRLSVYSDSCFFSDDLLFAPFIRKKIPFPCTIILFIGGLAAGLSDPSLNLCFNFQLVCALGRAA